VKFVNLLELRVFRPPIPL